MTVEISVEATMAQEDIIEALISFARSNNTTAFKELYKQYFKEADVAEIQRCFLFIIKTFIIAKKTE